MRERVGPSQVRHSISSNHHSKLSINLEFPPAPFSLQPDWSNTSRRDKGVFQIREFFLPLVFWVQSRGLSISLTLPKHGGHGLAVPIVILAIYRPVTARS